MRVPLLLLAASLLVSASCRSRGPGQDDGADCQTTASIKPTAAEAAACVFARNLMTARCRSGSSVREFARACGLPPHPSIELPDNQEGAVQCASGATVGSALGRSPGNHLLLVRSESIADGGGTHWAITVGWREVADGGMLVINRVFCGSCDVEADIVPSPVR